VARQDRSRIHAAVFCGIPKLQVREMVQHQGHNAANTIDIYAINIRHSYRNPYFQPETKKFLPS